MLPKTNVQTMLPTVILCGDFFFRRLYLVADFATCNSKLAPTRNTRSMWTILIQKKKTTQTHTTHNVRRKFCYFLIFFFFESSSYLSSFLELCFCLTCFVLITQTLFASVNSPVNGSLRCVLTFLFLFGRMSVYVVAPTILRWMTQRCAVTMSG